MIPPSSCVITERRYLLMAFQKAGIPIHTYDEIMEMIAERENALGFDKKIFHADGDFADDILMSEIVWRSILSQQLS